jgi:hypothetical protein
MGHPQFQLREPAWKNLSYLSSSGPGRLPNTYIEKMPEGNFSAKARSFCLIPSYSVLEDAAR